MAWELSEQHLAFQSSCRDFVRAHVAPQSRMPSGRRPSRSSLWKELASAELLGLTIGEDYGGVDAGALAVALLAEELAKASSGIAVTVLVNSYMAASHIAAFGNAEQRSAWLRRISDGEAVTAIAVTEPGSGSDVAAIRTAATELPGGGYRLNGTKMFITNAGLADVFVIAAKTQPALGHRGISTFIVPQDTPGISVGNPLAKMGWHSSDTRELVIDDVEVPASALLGVRDRGFYQIMHAFQLERIALAGMGVGLAQACLTEATSHCRTRQAFGSTLAGLQTVRHRLATMSIDVQTARLITYQAADRMDQRHDGAAESVAIAKYVAARAANRVADDAVQLFGGSGYIDETPVARHYRDARILRIGGGTDEIQLEILAKGLLG